MAMALRSVASRLRSMRTVCRTVFIRYPLIPNTTASGGLFMVGDLLIQRMENKQLGNKWISWLNSDRATRILTIGCVLGAGANYWYRWLDSRFPGTAFRPVVRKLALDMLVAGPCLIVAFIGGIKLLEGSSVRESWAGVKKAFIPIYSAELVYWIGAQTINFKYVPAHYRTLYVTSFAFVWDTFLSYFHHVYMDYQSETEEEAETKEDNDEVGDIG